MKRMSTSVTGIVCTGLGQGRAFSQIDWVRRQFLDKVGFAPYPGTLNLRVENPEALAAWRVRRGVEIEPEAESYCAAKCFRVRIADGIEAVWIIPLVPNYPEDMIELMAPFSLRDELSLKTGDVVKLEIGEEE